MGCRGEGRRGEAAHAAPAKGPSPNPASPLAPTPHASLLGPLRLTVVLRLASAPVLSSDATQGAWPLKTALCSAVNFICRDAVAAPRTRVSGGGGRTGGGCLRRVQPPGPTRATHHQSHARPPAGLHASRVAEGRQPAVGRQRGAATEERSGGGTQRRRQGTALPRSSGATARSLPRSLPTPTHPLPPRCSTGPRRT